ncbi:MAG TPA: hypothetical protein PK855_00930, partial [Bacteroidales bacterium]|nr:hypothetical protein [Bacteroidales bacterium]
MTLKNCLLILLLSLPALSTHSQTGHIGDFDMDERSLYAMTKQMSQFFSRFNQEEDQFGKKLHPSSPDYRNNDKRKLVLPLLFDAENLRTSSSLRDYFIQDLTRDKDSNFMAFLGGRWYAEAEATFAQGRRTVLFVDEVHRFNKSQQDAFLPHIERGVIILVGATTENP